ncbi:MAG: energy transducer TonB [Janthinobacterium lividum]
MTSALFSRQITLAASVFLAATGGAAAQTMPNAVRVTHVPDSAKVYNYVEQMPQLPGKASIVAPIQERVAAGSGCGGKVFVSFVVGPSGVVRDAKVVKGPAGGCNAAVLAAVGKLPRFRPGKQNGQAVAVIFTLPLSF